MFHLKITILLILGKFKCLNGQLNIESPTEFHGVFRISFHHVRLSFNIIRVTPSANVSSKCANVNFAFFYHLNYTSKWKTQVNTPVDLLEKNASNLLI